MPIKGVSEARRVPRLGKIRLGIKVEKSGKNPYPHPTDYFVVPDEIKPIVGDKPKELHIMFPSDDITLVAPQWLRCYGLTHGLVCWGDGEAGHRKIDTGTGAIASRDTKEWAWSDWNCNPEDCLEFGARCRKVMNLMFLLPQVPGLGVWQIDTSSFHSIREINSTLDLLKQFTRSPQHPDGRIAFIPLTLTLGPVEVNPPETGRKTVYIMHIKTDFRLAEVARYAQLPPARVLMPQPEVEEPPEDLFPERVLAELEREEPPVEQPKEAEETFPGLEEDRLKEWQAIHQLRKEVKVNAKATRSYFVQVHDVSVPLADFDQSSPPGQLTLHMLRAFSERLEHHRMNLG